MKCRFGFDVDGILQTRLDRVSDAICKEAFKKKSQTKLKETFQNELDMLVDDNAKKRKSY